MQLVEFLETNSIMSNNQFGCRKGHSTEMAMVAVTDIVKKYIDKGFFAVVISIDLRKAFDSVHKEKLLKKLEKYRISEYWLRDYLSGRKQFVEVNNKVSQTR